MAGEHIGRRLAIELFMVSVIGFLLGLVGPFGTFAAPAPLRIGYWLIFAIAGYLVFRPLVVVGRWLAEALRISPLIGIGLAQMVASVPMTLIVATLLSGFDVVAALRWNGLGALYFQVWLIGFLVNGFFALVLKGKEQREAPDATPAPAMIAPVADAPTSFADRLPPGFGPLLALKGEDHYVRAIGETREELVLIRLRDAIAELGATEGLQVHRSWWVARAGVASTRKEGRTATVLLHSGTEVPVSREMTPELRRLGWV